MIFRRALIRLTLTYALVQLAVYGAFALAVYLYVVSTFDFDPESTEPGVMSAEQGFATLREALLVAFAVLVVLIPLASWIMARSALIPIQRSYELQQRFIDGASHELRSPLALIQGELELALSRSRSPAEYRAAIGTAAEATHVVVALTNDLLLLARGDSDELSESFTTVDVDDLVARAAGAGATVPHVSVDCRSGAHVMASPALLSRAVSNLLDNASKFTPSEGQITVTTQATADAVFITVADTGVGMTPDELRHARVRFWRADTARSRTGHGLGLALVDSILAAHHGSLELRSQLGQGTTATIRLPLATSRGLSR